MNVTQKQVLSDLKRVFVRLKIKRWSVGF